MKSLDAQSWNCGTITRFIVSQEKIFETVISPILTYGSEVWGVDHDRKLENDPLHSFTDTVGSPSKIKYSAFLGVKNVKGLSRLFGADMMEIKVAEINAPLN